MGFGEDYTEKILSDDQAPKIVTVYGDDAGKVVYENTEFKQDFFEFIYSRKNKEDSKIVLGEAILGYCDKKTKRANAIN